MWTHMEDRKPGREVRLSYHSQGWVEREQIPVKLPACYSPRTKLIVRTFHATGTINVSLEGLQVE
jgi:hypothetical protein